MSNGREALTMGTPKLWAEFQSQHEALLKHIPDLVGLYEAALDSPKELPTPVDRVVHGLTRMCIEEFMEIIVVCGNGCGIAGLKLLRTLYENAVSARYLHLEPAEVGQFLDYVWIDQWKIMRAIDEEFPGDMEKELSEAAERDYLRVKPAFEVELCPECHRRGTNYRWSKLDFVSMALKCNGLDEFLVPAYRDLLKYTHAGAGGLFARVSAKGDTIVHRGVPQWEEADSALFASHAITLRVIGFYMEHFDVVSLQDRLHLCGEKFFEIWEAKDRNGPSTDSQAAPANTTE
jgi:hypothetical protein